MAEATATNGASLSVSPMGANGSAPPSDGASNPADLDTLIDSKFDARFADHLRKLNKELAEYRKYFKPEAKSTDTKPSPTPDGAPAVTQEDWKHFRAIGKLEAQLGDELVAGLDYENLPPAQQLLMLTAALKGHEAGRKADRVDPERSRGEVPVRNRTNSRAEPPSPRDGTPRPNSRREWVDLQKKDPRAAAELLKQDDFDPRTLPLTWPRGAPDGALP